MLDGGNLSSLDMTINSNFEVADVTFNATNLNFDYVGGKQQLLDGGDGGGDCRRGRQPLGHLRLRWYSRPRDHRRQPFQSRYDDQCHLRRGRRRDQRHRLNFDYVATGGGTFSMSGTAGVKVGEIDSLSVTFGSNGTPGLVISDGSLVSLDMTVNATFDVADVAFNATDLNFDYVASGGGTFSMSGTVGVTVGGIDGLSVTFGANGTPGLVISDGSLSSLDMTINATFDVDSVEFNATNLNFDYVAATDTFSMAGTVGVTVGGLDSLSVTFGDASANPITDPADYYGLIIQNGSLVSLNMFVNAKFTWPTSRSTPRTSTSTTWRRPITFSMAGTVGVHGHGHR